MAGWAAFAQIASKVADQGFQLYGQRYSARAARNMQLRDQRWREYMRGTNFQAAASDLEKAGLNRILAVSSPGQAPGASGGSGPGQPSSSPIDVFQAKVLHQQARKAQYEADILWPKAVAGRMAGQTARDAAKDVDKATSEAGGKWEWIKTQATRGWDFLKEHGAISKEPNSSAIKNKVEIQKQEDYIRNLRREYNQAKQKLDMDPETKNRWRVDVRAEKSKLAELALALQIAEQDLEKMKGGK